MALTVEIDPGSGFCGGVIRAIGTAENLLRGGGKLYSLGAIVHNDVELGRLQAQGLVTLRSLDDGRLGAGDSVLVRAHGEPPSTYARAREKGLRLVDCTCPVVLKLQQRIREAYARLHEGGRDGQVVLFGKVGHAEVLGLVGQAGGDVTVVENEAMLEEAVREGRLRLDRPVAVFSQTTKSPEEYRRLCARLEALMLAARCSLDGEALRQSGELEVHDTICSQVASRHADLGRFAREHDVVIFVAGEDSSNGKVLRDLCLSLNPRTHQIGSSGEIRPEWFRDGDRVGVCGATSTPQWLLEQVATQIRNL